MWSSSLWKCSVLATLWIIWLERNRIYGDSSEEDVNSLWNRARFLASLWASKEFQDTWVFFFFVHLNWEGVLGQLAFVFWEGFRC